MLRGHGADDALAGGASVVVRDGESPLHGEGTVSYTHLDVYKRQAETWQAGFNIDTRDLLVEQDALRLSLIHI